MPLRFFALAFGDEHMNGHAVVRTAGALGTVARERERTSDGGRTYRPLRAYETMRRRGDLAGTRDSREGGFSAPPCFFHRDCGGTAAVEKQGKAVCRACADGLKGTEYPLRAPSREPLYRKAEELVLQLEMKEGRRKRGGE